MTSRNLYQDTKSFFLQIRLSTETAVNAHLVYKKASTYSLQLLENRKEMPKFAYTIKGKSKIYKYKKLRNRSLQVTQDIDSFKYNNQ